MIRFIRNLMKTGKELCKLLQQLTKLVIECISLIGWIYILIKLFA